ncbi:MFS transporter [Pseudoalteromonas piscicida]|uniref:MFS transporter n=1 Tax=Pseudoalteromonas TaxID=53246 RepID=UPI001D0A4FC1|nr:MFS transporter [Pseudoalteromonas piscicida]UDM60509.1 MFS transporter [Pseudoalteromonas piscicida]
MPVIHLLLCSVTIFFVLYAPQPLLAEFAEQFNVSASDAGMLMSATMLPLAIAPICYGLLLAKSNPLRILKWTMLLLALSSLAFASMTSFSGLLFTRLIQGLLLPAALTAMTGYIGQQFSGSQLKRNMSLYIGSTIAGGYFGRTLAANFTVWFEWQSFYYLNALLLIVLAFSIRASKNKPPIIHATRIRDYLAPLKQSRLVRLYSSVFCMFFCFAGLLNFLPFILKYDFNLTDPSKVGWVYTGYLVGALGSIVTPWLQSKFHSTWRFLAVMFLVYAATIALLPVASVFFFVVLFTLFCGCMFVIHSTAAPLANSISQAPATVTNGAYVSFYYSGGVLGSYLPGLIYEQAGIAWFCASLFIVCTVGLALSLRNTVNPVR